MHGQVGTAPIDGPGHQKWAAWFVGYRGDIAFTVLEVSGSPRVSAARLAVAGYLAGGRAALAAITAADYDVLAVTPHPDKRVTARLAIQAYLRGR